MRLSGRPQAPPTGDTSASAHLAEFGLGLPD